MLQVINFIFISILSMGVCTESNCPGPGATCNVNVPIQSRIIATMPCPFTSTGKLNLPMVDELCEVVHKSCITGVFASGYYGGGMQCSREELQQLAKRWELCANKYGLDLFFGVGAFGSLTEVFKLAKYVSKLNVTAMFAFAEPILQPEDPSEQTEDMQKICEAAGDKPLFYHQLSFLNQKVDTAQSYISGRNVVSCFAGAVGSVEELLTIRASTPGAADCDYYTDTSDQMGPGLLIGAKAATSLANSLCPGLALAMEAAANANNVAEVLKLQNQMNTVIAAACNPYGGRIDDTSRCKYTHMIYFWEHLDSANFRHNPSDQSNEICICPKTYIEQFKVAYFLKTGLDTGYRYPMERPNSTVYDQIASNWECVKDLCY